MLRHKLTWRIATLAVTLGSLFWVAVLLARAWPDLAKHADEIKTAPLLAGLLLCVLSAYLTFEAFLYLARVLRLSSLDRKQLAHFYFTAQLLKHLPGRVWGLGYQWAGGRAAGTLADWVAVNLTHLLLATFFALWSGCIVLGFANGLAWGMLASFSGFACYGMSWWVASWALARGWLSSTAGRIGRRGWEVCHALLETPRLGRLNLFVLFCASWLIYYLGWLMYGLAYPSVGATAAVRLCALYMIAWFVGYVSLITPSGLGVRELIFAWLAKDHSPDVIAMMAIVGRSSLLATDVVLGMIFAPFRPGKS